MNAIVGLAVYAEVVGLPGIGASLAAFNTIHAVIYFDVIHGEQPVHCGATKIGAIVLALVQQHMHPVWAKHHLESISSGGISVRGGRLVAISNRLTATGISFLQSRPRTSTWRSGRFDLEFRLRAQLQLLVLGLRFRAALWQDMRDRISLCRSTQAHIIDRTDLRGGAHFSSMITEKGSQSQANTRTIKIVCCAAAPLTPAIRSNSQRRSRFTRLG